MNSEFGKAAAALALGFIATGCAEHSLYEHPGDSTFGEANRQTMMAQIIDPDPVYAEAVPVSSGDHAADAIERYREDRIKEPDSIRTTDAGGGGGE